MTVSTTLGLECGLGNLKLTLAELSDPDFYMLKGILKNIDFEPMELFLDFLAGFASTRN